MLKKFLIPNSHKLELFKAIDIEYLLKNNEEYSEIWENALAEATISPDLTTSSEIEDDDDPINSQPTLSSIGMVGISLLIGLVAVPIGFSWYNNNY